MADEKPGVSEKIYGTISYFVLLFLLCHLTFTKDPDIYSFMNQVQRDGILLPVFWIIMLGIPIGIVVYVLLPKYLLKKKLEGGRGYKRPY